MDNIQSIQWFPGHMKKTERKIQESLKLVDIVAEVIDARIPISSRNPVLDKLADSKPRIILINKSDMADSKQTLLWMDYYNQFGIESISIDCKTDRGLSNFVSKIKILLKDKIEIWKSKGIKQRNIRVMVVGVPNVGKSSFINKMAKTNKAKVEDRPGVTIGNQWFSIGNGIELLDTPGLLWPKFDDISIGEKLAFTGAIKDQILDVEHLAQRLLDVLRVKYLRLVCERYKLNENECVNLSSRELLLAIGRKRGMLVSAGEINIERAAIMILDEFRSNKLGKITLEEAIK